MIGQIPGIATAITEGWKEFYMALDSGLYIERPRTFRATAAGADIFKFSSDSFFYGLRAYGRPSSGNPGNDWWSTKMVIGNSFLFIESLTLAAALLGNDPRDPWIFSEPFKFGTNEIMDIEIQDNAGNGVDIIDIVFLTIAPILGSKTS